MLMSCPMTNAHQIAEEQMYISQSRAEAQMASTREELWTLQSQVDASRQALVAATR